MLRLASSISFALIIAIASGSGNAQAQSPASDPAALLERIKTVTEELDLSADQKTQIEADFKGARDDLQSSMQDMQNASQDEKADRARQVLADLRQQVGQVLTDSQKQALQQKLESLRNATTAPTDGGTPAPTPSTGTQRGGFGNAGRNGGPPGRGQRLQLLKNSLAQLNLTSDQQSQVDDLMKDVGQQMQSLRAAIQSGSGDREALRQKGRAIFDDTHDKLAKILTSDQQEKLRGLMQGGASVGPAGGGAGALAGGLAGGPRQRPPIAASPEKTPIPIPPATTQPVQAVGKPNQAPAAGQSAPDFSLKTLSGNSISLATYNHKLLVLVLGSYTNPSLRDRAAGLETLRNQFGMNASFVLVYTKETHPAGGWEVQRNKTDNIEVTQPKDAAERQSVAQRAQTALKLSVTFAPDTMDDKTATDYAVGEGTPAYVIRDGKIVFHQSWLEPMALGQAITDALKK